VFNLFQKKRFSQEDFLRKAEKFDPFEIQKYGELCAELERNAEKRETKHFGLRTVVLSDTHGYLAFGEHRFPKFLDAVGAFDLCILLGDHHPAELPLILDCVPAERIVAIRGNHDSFSQYDKMGIRDISGKSFTFGGVRFAGIDGSFRYKNESFPSYTQYESLMLSMALPDADVLLSHDGMLRDPSREPAHAGLVGINHYLYTRPVHLHLHGHVHKSYEGICETGVREKCVYLCERVEI